MELIVDKSFLEVLTFGLRQSLGHCCAFLDSLRKFDVILFEVRESQNL